jgi:hypothetical protein
MKKIIEMWETRGGFKERITWNPCNCHPNDVMREYGNGKKLNKAVCYAGQNKSVFTKWMLSRGHKRLSREVIKLK